MYKVYLIENKINGKKYIGITKKTINERFNEHIKDSNNLINKRRLCQAIRKYGEKNFSVIMLEECSLEKIFDAEINWIKFYKTKLYEYGYNMTDGGEGCLGRENSFETLEKLSKSLKKQRSSMTKEDLKKMTAPANKVKKGYKESEQSKKLKSKAQSNRFAKMTNEQRKDHGARSRAGISAEGKINQIKGWHEAFSPVREKGFKQELTTCPHCDKMGGKFAMKRYHFDNCKDRRDLN